MNTSSRNNTFRLAFVGMMAAVAFISNYLRIPFLGSQIHIGNAVCVLCGLFFGPASGFLSAGLGNMLYDIIAGYGAECLITLVSKGAIALVAGAIGAGVMRKAKSTSADIARIVVASLLGAATYVVLYMLKTFIFGLYVNGLGMDGTLAKMASKLPASLINGSFATIAAPIFAKAIAPALRRLGVFEKV